MKFKCLVPFIIFLFTFQIISAQVLTFDKLLKIESHPTDESKIIVKFYNKNSRKLTEYWEMVSSVSPVTANNFNKLWKKGDVFPHGKYYKLYENGKRELEENYEYGYKVGDFTGFYETGEVFFKGTYNRVLEGKLLHFYKNGSINEESNFNRGLKNGKTIYYDKNGRETYEINYLNGVKDGKSLVYFLDGEKVKRKMKYKTGKLISEKCFDISGNKIDCVQLINEPVFAGGQNNLKSEIDKINFDFNSESNSADICNVILNLDSAGNASLNDYQFPRKELLRDIILDWVNNLPAFKPMFFDGAPKESIINLTFPVNKNKVIWLGDLTVKHENIRYKKTQTDYETFFWEFPFPRENKLFFIAEKMPQYPGGKSALSLFFTRNIKYPEEALKQQIEGKVYVSFVVDKNGKLSDFKIKKGVSAILDNEALRVAKLMPDWIPGETGNKKESVPMAVPVIFYINNNTIVK